MVEQLGENPYVRSAALVASKFHIDPVLVLKSSYFEWCIRVAAANYVSELEAEAAKNQKKASTQGGQQVPSWIG